MCDLRILPRGRSQPFPRYGFQAGQTAYPDPRYRVKSPPRSASNHPPDPNQALKYKDLRDFVEQLERQGELRRIAVPVSPKLEMTDIADRVLQAQGPALLFERPEADGRRWTTPVLANLFGTPYRVALGMGEDSTEALREVGRLLAALKEPEPPKGFKDAWEKLPMLRHALSMSPKEVSSAPCQQEVLAGSEVDLDALPVQTCWPGDRAPLITWGLVVTRGPNRSRQNLGIYRQQVLNRNQTIMRWLAHRGGEIGRAHV